MSNLPITGVFNDGYIAEMYESFRRDPGSVDESWHQLFRLAESLGGFPGGASGGATGGAPADSDLAKKAAGAAGLAQAIRIYGHLAVPIDPLGSKPMGAPELTPEFHEITEEDLEVVPASALGFEDDERFRTAADVIRMLRKRYTSTLGLQVTHLPEEHEREWFRRVLREEELTRPMTPDEKKAMLRRLSEVEGLERFLGRAYQGKKRFSIEGTDMLVPMLDAAMEEAAADGAREMIIGMAHRGRLNVLTHVMGKPYEALFAEFEGKHASTNQANDTGDVKYHMGYRGAHTVPDGRTLDVLLMPNPSHLEFVNPVINGAARARQLLLGEQPGVRETNVVLPVAVHGDAAFIGEGVVAETLNMSRLRGFAVGGTLHIIANNQVGFTTDPIDSRSTHYASDLGLGFDIPIVHVNADDPEACIAAVRVGIAYRKEFGKDFVIDLVGYRRHGHNETDEPAFTQPKLYAAIRKHPTVREVWGQRLVREGVVTEDEVKAAEREVAERLESIFDDMKARKTGEHAAIPQDGEPAPPPKARETAVPAEQLVALNEQLLAWPETLKVIPRLAKNLQRRRDALQVASREDLLANPNAVGIDWGHAEALAVASLLVEGTSVRITGQDVERGTFSHRQAVLHDSETGEIYIPLKRLPDSTSRFEIHNSPLTETAVMGFEYGYSVANPDALVMWEAQFGDFANVAAPIMDQFLAADRAKWGQDSGLVLLLPHGYEGQGPEHSSARLERFLQLAAEGNMVVAYPSTPAQYFHILRRQAKRRHRRPLVLMQPKSLLRLREASSLLADLATGRFQSVIDSSTPPGEGAADRDAVRRLVLCTGKLYYDLAAAERPADVAIVRVEELYPWPAEELGRVLARHPAVSEIVWAQEEPRNMGAWMHASHRLLELAGGRAVRYVGRPERASPAEGYESAHKLEQARIVQEALGTSEALGTRPGAPRADALGDAGNGAKTEAKPRRSAREKASSGD